MEAKKRTRRTSGNHRTLLLAARIDPNSEAGRIALNLLDEGYSKSEIVENSLLAANGQLPKKDSMDNETLINLRNAISRLEKLAESMSTGALITPRQQEEVGELKAEFVQAMRSSARPAFRRDS